MQKLNEIIPEKSAVYYVSLEFLERFLFTKSLEIIYRYVKLAEKQQLGPEARAETATGTYVSGSPNIFLFLYDKYIPVYLYIHI